MKNIDEVARKFAEENEIIKIKDAFRAGVEFAQQWHSVEDELPEFDKENPFKKYLVKAIEGSITPKDVITISHLRNQNGNWSCEMGWFRVTHWRYLELK